MAVDWNLAQVVSAVLAILATIIIAHPFLDFILKAARRFALHLRRKIRPRETQCERLEWMDLPEGALHECTIPMQNCHHIGAGHHLDNEEPESIICDFFQYIKRRNIIAKPHRLDLGTRYVRTDPKLLKALLFMLSCHYHPDPFLAIEDVGLVRTAYFARAWAREKLSEYRSSSTLTVVTKTEVERILAGYPPWYYEKPILANGSTISSPLRSAKDISRGGWIIAVGLGPASPTIRHFMKRLTPDTYGTPIYPTLERAFKRLIHCLSTAAQMFPVEPHINEIGNWLGDVIREMSDNWSMSTLHSLLVQYNISSLFGGENGLRERILNKRRAYASELSVQQCEMAIQAFNKFDGFSRRETEVLGPVIEEILKALVVGSYEVMDYFCRRDNEAYEKWDREIRKTFLQLDERPGPIFLRAWREGDRELS